MSKSNVSISNVLFDIFVGYFDMHTNSDFLSLLCLLSDGVGHRDILFNHLMILDHLICVQQCDAPVNQMN